MSEKLIKLLDTYEDFELAFLYQYRLDTYMNDTQTSVKDYIKNKRGLTDEKIRELIDEIARLPVNPDGDRCPRCKSSKIKSDREELTNTSYNWDPAAIDGVFGKATYTQKKICSVCGFVIKDDNNFNENKPLYKKLFSYFLNRLMRIRQ